MSDRTASEDGARISGAKVKGIHAITGQTRIPALEHGGRSFGSYRDPGGRTVAFHRTPIPL